MQVVRRMESHAFSMGLNPAQWNALRYLNDAAPSARSVAAFARYHRATTGTSSQTVESLVKKGLVQREPDPFDRRQSRLNVTENGVRMLEEDPINLISDAIDQLDETRQQVLLDLLTGLLTDDPDQQHSGRRSSQAEPTS